MTIKGTRLGFQPPNLSLKVLLIAAILIGILLRLLNLASREFWYDEVVSLLIYSGNLQAYQDPYKFDFPVLLSNYTPLMNIPPENGLKDVLQHTITLVKSFWQEPHPPLFYLSQNLWLRLFGNGEAASRSLNTLLSILGIGTSYGLGKVVLGHRGGLILAALVATNPFFLMHSLNVRMYTPLILWASLSAWALLELIRSEKANPPNKRVSCTLWSLVLIVAVACGFMTFYLFAYFIMALGVLVLVLDRRNWWKHGLRLGAGVVITLPWLVWGTKRQLSNADVGRFSNTKGALFELFQHLGDMTDVLGRLLVWGDWAMDLPKVAIMIAGLIAFFGLVGCAVNLWQKSEYQTLKVALMLGLFPLLLAVGIDIITGKFTIAWGWGRSMIFILPGCLLLITVWLEHTGGRWREVLTGLALLCYLSLSISDMSLRSRTGMTTLAEVIQTQPNVPTLIAMTSRARGHVLRLAYYIDPANPVALLAESAPNLIERLKIEATQYPRVIVLDSQLPVYSDQPATAQQQQQIQQVLEQQQFQKTQTQKLDGTLPLDRFQMSLYYRQPS